MKEENVWSLDIAGSQAQKTSNGTTIRLTPEATDLLTSYFARTPNPTSYQRDQLLLQIRALEGCQEYDQHKLYSWFARKRHAVKHDLQREKPKNDSKASTPQLHDGLTPVVRPPRVDAALRAKSVAGDMGRPPVNAHLETYLRSFLLLDPDPTPNTILAWTKVLEANRTSALPVQSLEVYNWVKRQKAARAANTYRPMTPAESVFSEPQSCSSSPPVQRRELMDVEMVASISEIQNDPQPRKHVQPDLLAIQPQPNLSVPMLPASTSSTIRRLNLFGPSAHHAQLSQETIADPPGSFRDAAERLAPVVDLAEHFLDLLDSGSLVALGWEAPPANVSDSSGPG
ncbi:hypothetical protein HWV62_39503 [Athelia sp. TMB]|nr:hypothetical protein HWV62_39503 [Athelia sp. TMB]